MGWLGTDGDRHLLTHTSGIVYDSMNLKLVEYRKTQGTQPYTGPTVETRFSYPLMYEPGSLWTYGAGMDWAGRIVELITDSTLEDYMQESLFKPLGIRDITFWPRKKGLDSRMVDLHPDDPTGAGIAVGAGMNVHNNSEACFGGQGLYGAGSEFIKIMSSILANDGKLLKKETVDLMFEPHLPYGGRESMRDFLKTEQGLAWFGCNTPRDALRDWGYGGLLQLEAVEGWPYGAKTLTWGGGVNSAWVS